MNLYNPVAGGVSTFDSDCIAAFESLNLTVFWKDPVLLTVVLVQCSLLPSLHENESWAAPV